ncbi:hypothetical protein JR316_0001201 [Psilocybe cubensis]|uniref:SAGA-associated factor 11 n=2 Tax=Psilocybe cubensis TaxID=181762 RepID=A0A8H7YBD5_PSICU|nr:hypothetical protein JR316_0001201 [Psilocybe cubensis]KAH9487132.1 hypothetical protein JR316_0001201 [Psilocybe cubensis]
MPKSEREETLAALTARVFAAMLEELVMDATLQTHHEVVRGKSVCTTLHNPRTTNDNSRPSGFGQRADTPSSTSGYDGGASKGVPNGTGASTPTSLKGDGAQLLECVSCQRQLAPNRYAPHLTTCLGLSTSRRGAVRGNATKPKQSSEGGRSASPLSDGGYISEEKGTANGKNKGKGKGKKQADEGDFTLKRKRLGSPTISPNKKPKKGKASGSPVSRVKADPELSGFPSNSHYSPSTTSQSKIPSKLRDSSTASFLDRSSASSRDSSPDGFVAGTPSSTFSTQSPTRPIAVNKAVRGRPLAMGTGPPRRPISPPRPQPIHVPDYQLEIDHANETGSSTDTDSD